MLMQSPSGMPACVFAESVEVLERRGFVLLSEVPRDDLSAKQPGASEKAGGTGSPDASKTGDRPFVTTWRTASPNESITIPVGELHGSIHCRLGRWNRNKRHRGRIACLC